jgi:hypothetical protein
MAVEYTALSKVSRLEAHFAVPLCRNGIVEFALLVGAASTGSHNLHVVEMNVKWMAGSPDQRPFVNFVIGYGGNGNVRIPLLAIYCIITKVCLERILGIIVAK